MSTIPSINDPTLFSQASVVFYEETVEEAVNIYTYLNSLSDDAIKRMVERDLAMLESHFSFDNRQVVPLEEHESEEVDSANQKSDCSVQSHAECTSKVAQENLSKMESSSNEKSSTSESSSSIKFCMII